MNCTELRIFFRAAPFDMSEWDEVDFNTRDIGFQITLRKHEVKEGTIVNEERTRSRTVYFDGQGNEVVRTEHDGGWTTCAVDRPSLPAGWKAREEF